MRWPRVVACIGLLCLVCLGLQACSTETSRLDTLTQTEPDSTRLRAMRRLSLASAYFEQGQNDIAQQEVRAALQIDPKFAEAYSLLGLIHQRDNAVVLAEQSFEHGLQLASLPLVRSADLAAIEHNYGWFLCQQNRFSEAQIQLTRAVSQPSYRQVGKTWMALGLCQVRAGATSDARLSFQHALAIEPSNAVSRYQWALLDWQDRQLSNAQATLAPLNAGEQVSAESLWLGIKIARALTQPHDLRKLSQQLTQQFPNSAQATAWAQRKFED